jgi:hypothetical protein
LYDPICLGPNIEEHAKQPLYYEGERHPDIDYINYPLLKISKLSPIMQELKTRVLLLHKEELATKNWLDFIKVRDIHFKCPKKIAFEKILVKEDPSTHDEAMMYNHCIHSIFAAAKRQMKRAPKPDPAVAADFVKFAKSIIDGTCEPHLRNAQLVEKLDHFGYSFQQWYKHNPAKKQHDIDKYMKYLAGKAEGLTQREIEELESTIYTGICKQEIQPVDGKSRMVCSIPIKTKVTMGPVTWKLEEIFAEHFPGYCGNKNLQQMSDTINKYIALGFNKVVEGDGSAFDNTQDVSLKAVDRHLYRKIAKTVYHVPVKQFLEISQQLCKTMDVNYIDPDTRKKKCLFRYQILGSVFSGDCDTTLANTMRMALYNIYVNEKAGLKYGKDYIVFSKGDDFTVLYKSYVNDEHIKMIYYKYFIKPTKVNGIDQTPVYGLGQVLKFITIGDPSTLSFCSLRAFYTSPTEDKIILVRNFDKFLKMSKYSRKIKILKGQNRVNYLLQQAISLRATYQGIHIFEAMADAYEYEARLYSQYYTQGNQQRISKMLTQAQRISIKTQAEVRKIVCEYIDENSQIDNIEYKHTMIVHQRNNEDWWDAVKREQSYMQYKLSTEQLKYINQQIQAEIFTEEFKATMGLNNFNHYA